MFTLNNNDPVPLYKQLYNQVREHILSGKLPANSKLPSVRNLAAELSTSRNTVEGAYQELYAEGYIYSKQRSGLKGQVLKYKIYEKNFSRPDPIYDLHKQPMTTELVQQI